MSCASDICERVSGGSTAGQMCGKTLFDGSLHSCQSAGHRKKLIIVSLQFAALFVLWAMKSMQPLGRVALAQFFVHWPGGFSGSQSVTSKT